jgi:lysophospholipase L1-like esterase
VHPLADKTTRTILVMLAVLAVPYAHPAMKRLRVVRAPWDRADDVAAFPGAPEPVASVGEIAGRATENTRTVANALPTEPDRTPLDPVILARTAGSVAVEDPSGHAMDAFYASLAKTLRGEPGAVTRILHYGDSMIASDYVSGTMRRRFQERFGDAGHGFILLANGWEWYFHNDVEHRSSDGWAMSRITGPFAGDGLYGLGGVSFHTRDVATATFGTVSKGDYGRSVSRFDVYYLEQPGGGDFQILVKGRDPIVVKTRGEKKVSRVASVEVPDGPAQMTVRTLGSGDVRAFGVVMERERAGVVYDALGALGGRAALWDGMKTEHWKEQMELRKPALVILMYGTNESEAGVVVEEQYRRSLGGLIDRIKDAAPGASVLVAAPPDRAQRGEGGELGSSKIVVKLVQLQREIAAEHRVAFWDTWTAMGGEGSMATWYKKGLCGGDLTHPTPKGAQLLGDLFATALFSGYAAYASRSKDAPAITVGGSP